MNQRLKNLCMGLLTAVLTTLLPAALLVYGCVGDIVPEKAEVAAVIVPPISMPDNGEKFRYAVSADNTTARDIPEQYRGKIVERTYTKSSNSAYFMCGLGCFRNNTTIPNATAQGEAAKPLELKIDLFSAPQVLILHTHATEAFDRYDVGYYDYTYPARFTDNSKNMVSVGAIVARLLNDSGIVTIHSDEQHDYPKYNGSYGRSMKTIQYYLEKYPSIKVVLDLHRDAIISGNTRYKPVAEINGVKAAQIMIIVCADNGSGKLPNFYRNLRLAAKIQHTAEQLYPGLTRPAVFGYTNYNQSASDGSLLIEIGSHANTLEEAQYTAELLGHVLTDVLIKQSR